MEEGKWGEVNESLSQKLKSMNDDEFTDEFMEKKFTPDEMELLTDCYNRLLEYVEHWLRTSPRNQMHLLRLIMQNFSEMFSNLHKAAHAVSHGE